MAYDVEEDVRVFVRSLELHGFRDRDGVILAALINYESVCRDILDGRGSTFLPLWVSLSSTAFGGPWF